MFAHNTRKMGKIDIINIKRFTLYNNNEQSNY